MSTSACPRCGHTDVEHWPDHERTTTACVICLGTQVRSSEADGRFTGICCHTANSIRELPTHRTVLTLTEFLLARIGEEEAVARAAMPHGARRNGKNTSRRRLAECEVKQRIVEEASRLLAGQEMTAAAASSRLSMEWVCQQLALPYADHPDYQREWKP